jgi:hypothetical protein
MFSRRNKAMKHTPLWLFLPLLFCFQAASSHKQAVHQYIAREGYALLLKTRNLASIPELSQFIGLVEQAAAGDSAWQKGFVTTGAWREDDEDVVFNYDILPGLNYALTSITHFWSADRGDAPKNSFRLQYDNPPPLPPLIVDTPPYENAFDKMMKFATGEQWVLNYPRTITCKNQANDHWLVIAPVVSTEGFGIPLSYSGLTSFYAQKRLTVHPEKPNVCVVFDVNDLKAIDLSSVSEIIVDAEVRNIIVWEVLGRMCHLLGDMSVPAHAHVDEHGLKPDSYEDYVGGPGDPYRAWSAGNVPPAIMLNTAGYDAIHFLMYTMQQQADHFGSNGPANGNGNDVLGGDARPDELDTLNAIDLSSLGGPTTDAGPWTADQLNNIRDKTVPYVIRATAGLLYWFCAKVGLLVEGVSDEGGRIPSAVSLSQNYPNPFNPSTTIQYSLPQRSSVTLTVFNTLGQAVAMLVQGEREAGCHEVQFDASGLPSGVYFYRMLARDFIETKRLLLLK